MNKIKTNATGFVTFKNRNFSYAGDKATWARVEKNVLTVQKARRGTISAAYQEEMEYFCSEHGINFGAVGFGDKIQVQLED